MAAHEWLLCCLAVLNSSAAIGVPWVVIYTTRVRASLHASRTVLLCNVLYNCTASCVVCAHVGDDNLMTCISGQLHPVEMNEQRHAHDTSANEPIQTPQGHSIITDVRPCVPYGPAPMPQAEPISAGVLTVVGVVLWMKLVSYHHCSWDLRAARRAGEVRTVSLQHLSCPSGIFGTSYHVSPAARALYLSPSLPPSLPPLPPNPSLFFCLSISGSLWLAAPDHGSGSWPWPRRVWPGHVMLKVWRGEHHTICITGPGQRSAPTMLQVLSVLL